MAMKRVVILGAGRIGRRIAELLAGRYAACLIEPDPSKIDQALRAGLAVQALPPGGAREGLRQALAGAHAMIALDAFLPPRELARLAIEAGCHYLDLFESDAAMREVAEEAVQAPQLGFAPGCGLAPGFVTALVAREIALAPAQAEITAFVGVLPLNPANRLGYANIWGIPGLLQEYVRPVLGLEAGRLVERPALGGAEVLELDGLALEAFSTAGSIDALARRAEGRVQGLDFKTLRYPGHRDYMLFLLDDLGLRQHLHRLASLLMTALPTTDADRVLIALRRIDAPGATPRWSVWHHRAGQSGPSAMSTLAAAFAVSMLDHIGGTEGAGLHRPGEVALDALRASPAFALLEGEAQISAREGVA